MPRTLAAITGASSGIGEEFARRFAPEHDLLLIARRTERLEEIASKLRAQYGNDVEIITADLSRPEDIARVAERLGSDERLAILVNNAGFGTGGYFWEAPLEPQEEMHRLHVMAPLGLTHAALRGMTARNYGAVINVASVASFIRRPGSASYSASKAWLNIFTEALHAELRSRRSQVVVQALCPGYTYSEFHDRLGLDRSKVAGRQFWHTAEFVVNASLEGLRRRKLVVVPGWRYRLLTIFLNSLPTSARVALETAVAPQRRKQAALSEEREKRIGG
jgi:short-subunit dehydrogenase